MIVVMIDFGNSWFVNWAVSEADQKNNFADHVCIDIINYIDKHFRTIAERKRSSNRWVVLVLFR